MAIPRCEKKSVPNSMCYHKNSTLRELWNFMDKNSSVWIFFFWNFKNFLWDYNDNHLSIAQCLPISRCCHTHFSATSVTVSNLSDLDQRVATVGCVFLKELVSFHLSWSLNTDPKLYGLSFYTHCVPFSLCLWTPNRMILYWIIYFGRA